jgi:hypothetical protein
MISLAVLLFALVSSFGSSPTPEAAAEVRGSQQPTAVAVATPPPLNWLAKNEPPKTKTVTSGPEKEVVFEGISRERAIAIARRDAISKYKSVREFNIVPCEQVVFWRVIFDGGGPEYIIDKLSGRIIRKLVLPQGSSARSDSQISRDEAFRIARNAVIRTYASKGEDVNRFAVFTCELSKAWRVIFDYKMYPGQRPDSFPNAGFPTYVIDKSTRKIIHKDIE